MQVVNASKSRSRILRNRVRTIIAHVKKKIPGAYSHYDRTNTLLSLFNALLSAAELFFASRSGARSRGNLDAVFGLRLPERLLLWFSFSGPSPLRRDPRVGRGREAAAAPLVSGAWGCDLSEGSGVGGLFVPVEAAAPVIAGSCGPCSGIDAAGAGGGCWC